MPPRTIRRERRATGDSTLTRALCDAVADRPMTSPTVADPAWSTGESRVRRASAGQDEVRQGQPEKALRQEEEKAGHPEALQELSHRYPQGPTFSSCVP